MDPYLENPDLWPEVHHLLISLLAETLNPQLLPIYRVAIEKRVYQLSGEDALLIGIPDVTVSRSKAASTTESQVAIAAPSPQPVSVMVPMPIEVQEGYLEVREVATQEVVTVIELLSPANKRPGRGRDSYLQKRDLVLGSHTHLVEVDLLRQGTPMPMTRGGLNSHYRILVSRQDRRPYAELYPFSVRDLIPPFVVPLKPESQEPVVELKGLLDKVMERSGLAVVLNYEQGPVPPFDAEDEEWCAELMNG
jgi:hypothetical protein